MHFSSIAICAAILAAVSPATAQSITQEMRGALSGIPQSVLHLENANGIHVTYHSPAAARSVGLGFGDERLSPGVASLGMTGPAPMLQYLLVEDAGGWPPRIGFAPLNLRSVVAVEAPPERAYAMHLTPGATASAEAAFQSTGYEAVIVAGGRYFSRGGEDFELNLQDRDPLDPFGGHLGQASRVAIEGDRLVYSSSTPLLLDIMWGQGAVLTDHPEVDRLLGAVDALPLGNAQVLQAVLLSDPLVFRPGPASADLTIGMPEVPPLGPWIMGMMIEASDGTNDTAVIALSFVTEDAAAAAAMALPATMHDYVSEYRREPLRDILPAAPVVAVSPADPRVLVLRLTSPYVSEQSELRRRTNFGFLRNMLFYGDLGFLAPL